MEFVRQIPHRRDAIAVLAAANLTGALYGFSWYRSQLAATPWQLWPLIPDSPLSVLLFSLVLVGLLLGRRFWLLEGLAYVGIVKYGLWSVVVIAHYWALTGDVTDFELAHLFASHIIMAAQGLWFAAHHHPGRAAVAAGLAWAVANDIVDYAFGHYPSLPLSAQLPFARGAAVSLTVLVVGTLWLMQLRRQQTRGGKERPGT